MSIPAGTICHIKFSTEWHIIDSRILVTFEPDDIKILQDVVSFQSTVMIKKRYSNPHSNTNESDLDQQMNHLSSRDLWITHCLIYMRDILFHTLMTPWYLQICSMIGWRRREGIKMKSSYFNVNFTIYGAL